MNPDTPSTAGIETDHSGRERRIAGAAFVPVIVRLERAETHLRAVSDRLERAESELAVLENTVRGVAREAGVSVGCQCDRCERSRLLISDGMMSCPTCGYRQTV